MAKSKIKSNEISDEEMPRYVRQCWEIYQQATEKQREREKESQGFWLGGRHQWRAGEVESRESANRPWMSINRCKPAVDQVENEARNNPPGPEAYPVGDAGSDKDGADITEGLIREYEYRSDAQGAYILGLRSAAASSRGCFEMVTEFVSDRSFAQQIGIKPVEDISMMFSDPNARGLCHEDAMWGGKIRRLTRDQVISELGKDLNILNRSKLSEMASQFGGWMADSFGWANDWTTTNLWTGGGSKNGFFYVCEFYRVIIEQARLWMGTDNILRFEDEPAPKGVTVKLEGDEPIERTSPRRKIMKYVVTALDLVKKTEWYGPHIPYYWILGPEMYVNGELHRLSLISNAMDSQRGLNYTATSAAELVGATVKSPVMGYEGSFDVVNAQGINPWESATTAMWSHLDIKPVWAVPPGGQGPPVLLPAPTHNNWEAPIQSMLELANFFGEQIKSATAVFFEPSMTAARNAQSGKAIQALQAQTNIGTLNWQDQMHRAIQLSYNDAVVIMKKLYSSQRVQTIVRADGQAENVEINREFSADTHDFDLMSNAYTDKKSGKREPRNSIADGQYAVRCQAGPKFKDRADEAISAIMDMLKVAPQLTQNPTVVARLLRMIGEGNPEVEAIADAIAPNPNNANPDQMQAQLAQLQAQNQQKDQLLQKMGMALQAKLPEIEFKRWKTLVDNVTKLRAAEITASKDLDNAKADRQADIMGSLLNMAHEAGMQAQQHEHEASQADRAAQNQQAAQVADQQHQTQMQESEPEETVQ